MLGGSYWIKIQTIFISFSLMFFLLGLSINFAFFFFILEISNSSKRIFLCLPKLCGRNAVYAQDNQECTVFKLIVSGHHKNM